MSRPSRPNRPRRPSTGLTHVGALLDAARGLLPKQEQPGRLGYESWRKVVGDRIAERARPGALKSGVLTVHVASAVWAQELSLLSATILERLEGAGIVARELRFRVGDVEPAPARPEAPRPPLPASLPEDLARKLDALGDPRLREVIAGAAAYALGGQKTVARKVPPGTRSPRSGAAENAPPARTGSPRTAARKDSGGTRRR